MLALGANPLRKAAVRAGDNVLASDHAGVAFDALRDQFRVLDMGDVRRIDAAGIAALISIYGSSRNAGNNFRVCNVTPHVEEILKLVGLDHVLVSRDAIRPSQYKECYDYPAA